MLSFAINVERRRATRVAVAAALAAMIIGTGALPAAAASAPYFVKNIRSGSGGSIPFELTVLGNIIIFTASGGGAGRELWRTDGTTAGTSRVLDIRPGGKSSKPRGLVRVGDKVFFSANDGLHGQELWLTDGTAIGTHLVKDIAPGKAHGMKHRGTIFPIGVEADGLAYFTRYAGDSLWRSDGTDAGTFMVPGAPASTSNLTAFGSRVYFGGEGKLWRSDGTAAGTKVVKDSSGAVVKEPREIVATDDLVFFQFKSSKLWRTNGTAAGTFKILDKGPGCTSSCDPMRLARAGDVVYFMPLGVPGIQLWRSDGAVGGTFSVAQTNSERSYRFAPVGDRMFIHDLGFNAVDVWVSDGSVDGTEQLEIPAGLQHVSEVFDVAGDPYYSALVDYDTPSRLYSTDGTAAGTVLVGPPSPGQPNWLTVIGDKVVFRAEDSRGIELWAMNL